MRRFPVALAAVALLLAGCADGGDATPSTTTSPTTTTATTTVPATTTLPATTTTEPAPAFVVGTPGLYPPDPLPGSGDANGSGCPPEAGPLPDGIWYGKALEVSPEAVRFDPGCFWFGDAALEQAALDGEIDWPAPHYLRNPMPDSLELAVAPGSVAYSIDNSTEELGFLTLSLDEWPVQTGGYNSCPGEGCPVWLYVNGGVVTEIQEQYLP
ncbi:MAG: hypothetical protein H6Q11_1521 [Acidobacteria bacterium]|nr:hypothetical protein [Acidobacteriota bacterium]